MLFLNSYFKNNFCNYSQRQDKMSSIRMKLEKMVFSLITTFYNNRKSHLYPEKIHY